MTGFKRFCPISVGVLFVLGCASHPVERKPDAEHEVFLTRAGAAISVGDRWKIGVEARLKAGLGFGYFAAIRENGVSSTDAAGSRALEPVVAFGKGDLLEIGSTTKTFTGILLHLAELEGKLKLDDRLDRFYDELKGTDAGGITLSELGHQRSGLVREPPGITIPYPTNPRHNLKGEEVIAALAKTKRAPIPEGKTERGAVYSNWGYMTLGLVLEKVYGRSYKDLVESKVLFPLGMRESGVDRKTRKHGKWIPMASAAFALDTSSLPLRDYDGFAAATGGIESNATDMAKFLGALETPPSGKLGQAISAGIDSGIGWDSGKGWRPDIPPNVIWKNGATSGHTAVLAFDRTTKKAIFIGSNSTASPDELGFFAVGVKTTDGLLAGTFPKRTPSADEIARLKGIFIPPGPIPNGQPPLRRVDVTETLGHLVAHYTYDGLSTGALLVPYDTDEFWSVIDGLEDVDHIRITKIGLNTTTALYSGGPTYAELKKISSEPEKYPALEK